MDYADLSDRDFRRFSNLVYEKCGINLHNGKKALVHTRLGKRLRDGGFRDFDDYYRFVRERDNQEELVQLLDAISTNLTSFFREEKHFAFLREQLFPSYVKRKQKRIRVWSAGCSSGEEPYSLAMSFFEYFGLNGQVEIRIFASDISTKVLSKARTGVYGWDRVSNLKQPFLKQYFQTGTGRQAGNVRVKEFVRERITFERINLMEPFPFGEEFDVIFCRNVMIYFDKKTQERLVNKFHDLLVDGGYLFIGLSESLTGVNHPLRYIVPTVYKKG